MTPPSAPFSSYAAEVYFQGLGGTTPSWPTDPSALEAAAREVLDDGPFGYVAGGAGQGATMRANREAFDRHALVPRMLRDTTVRDWSTTVLGTRMPAPLLLGPIGVLSILAVLICLRSFVAPAVRGPSRACRLRAVLTSGRPWRASLRFRSSYVDRRGPLTRLPSGARARHRCSAQRSAIVACDGEARRPVAPTGAATGSQAGRCRRRRSADGGGPPGPAEASTGEPTAATRGLRTAAARDERRQIGHSPYAYGLALGGEDGVRHVVRSVLAELDLTLALSGYASLAQLRAEPDAVRTRR